MVLFYYLFGPEKGPPSSKEEVMKTTRRQSRKPLGKIQLIRKLLPSKSDGAIVFKLAERGVFVSIHTVASVRDFEMKQAA